MAETVIGNLNDRKQLPAISLPEGISAERVVQIVFSVLYRKALLETDRWAHWVLLATVQILEGNPAPPLDISSLCKLRGLSGENRERENANQVIVPKQEMESHELISFNVNAHREGKCDPNKVDDDWKKGVESDTFEHSSRRERDGHDHNSIDDPYHRKKNPRYDDHHTYAQRHEEYRYDDHRKNDLGHHKAKDHKRKRKDSGSFDKESSSRKRHSSSIHSGISDKECTPKKEHKSGKYSGKSDKESTPRKRHSSSNYSETPDKETKRRSGSNYSAMSDQENTPRKRDSRNIDMVKDCRCFAITDCREKTVVGAVDNVKNDMKDAEVQVETVQSSFGCQVTEKMLKIVHSKWTQIRRVKSENKVAQTEVHKHDVQTQTVIGETDEKMELFKKKSRKAVACRDSETQTVVVHRKNIALQATPWKLVLISDLPEIKIRPSSVRIREIIKLKAGNQMSPDNLNSNNEIPDGKESLEFSDRVVKDGISYYLGKDEGKSNKKKLLKAKFFHGKLLIPGGSQLEAPFIPGDPVSQCLLIDPRCEVNDT